MTDPLQLHTLSMSQSSEKVRWALDAAGLDYQEHRLTPFVHLPRSFLVAGGIGAALPVLEADGETLQDSTRIFEWLAQHRAPFSLIPAQGPLRTAVMQAESRFDHLAQHVLRSVYARLSSDPALLLRLWSVDASRLDALALRAAFPVLSRVFGKALDLRPAARARSQRMLERGLEEVARAEREGRRYLVGDRLSVADITAAAMLSPLACPDEHCVYARADYRAAMQPLLQSWQGHPGLDWVRALYQRHRQARPQAERLGVVRGRRRALA